MQLRHHKLVLTITALALIVIGVAIARSIYEASPTMALPVISFSYLLLLVVLVFVLLSVVLRTRDELHELHAELRDIMANGRDVKTAKRKR